MHHPEWDWYAGGHSEEDELIALCKYYFCVDKPSTPKSLINEVKVGDNLYLRPRTMKRRDSKPKQLTAPRTKDYFRHGTITSLPTRADVVDSLGFTSPDWYFVEVGWSDVRCTDADKLTHYKNKPYQTLSLQE